VRKLGVGVIGTGFSGKMHARAALANGARLVGVVGTDGEKSRRVAEQLGAEERFADARSLIEHQGVDVVHVCTPNVFHVPLADCALAQGKHVVCEKPLAVSVKDAVALAARAAEAGVVAAVPFVYRYHAMVLEARSRIAAGQLGAVQLVHGSYLQDWLLGAEDANWRVSAEIGGPSRAFADIGAHWCDLVEWLTGQRITQLCALTKTAVPERPRNSRPTFEPVTGVDHAVLEPVETEDLACLIFRLSAGAAGALTVSQVSAGRKNRIWLEIDGSRSSLAFDEERAEQLWLGRRAGNEILLRDPLFLSRAAAGVTTLPAGHNEGFADTFAALLGDVYEAALGGERRYPTFDDGLRAVCLTDAVLRSSAERSWAEVDS
jgi:predicted dehydrogenase